MRLAFMGQSQSDRHRLRATREEDVLNGFAFLSHVTTSFESDALEAIEEGSQR
jgi:hypothetical protein